jgi:hypothetical protein
MEKVSEQIAEQTGQQIVELLQTRVRTVQGAIEILTLTIMVMMKRLPPKDKEEIRQAVINGIRAAS